MAGWLAAALKAVSGVCESAWRAGSCSHYGDLLGNDFFYLFIFLQLDRFVFLTSAIQELVSRVIGDDEHRRQTR